MTLLRALCQNAVNLRTRLSLAFVFLVPLLARADPVSVNGQSLIAFAIVAFWALVIESGLVTLVLIPCGPLIIPLFGTLIVANVLVFLIGFLPLNGHVSLYVLEPGVALVDAFFIKLVSSLPFVQGAAFLGVTWRRALLASLLGNAVSFFVGVLAGGEPWLDHQPGGGD